MTRQALSQVLRHNHLVVDSPDFEVDGVWYDSFDVPCPSDYVTGNGAQRDDIHIIPRSTLRLTIKGVDDAF